MADSLGNRWLSPTRWLPAALVALALVAVPKPPVIDEESYLWLGKHVTMADPYAWTRAWQGQDGWVYAHPPLFLWWMKLASVLDHPAAIRLVAGIPFVALYGWAAALWMRRTTHHPYLAAAALLGSATVVLGVQDSLMIDLPYVALLTFGLAAYREGLEDDQHRWYAVAGCALGLAIETKYPAALVLPVLLASPVRLPPLAFWAPLATIIGGVEGYLFAIRGEFHPWAVWSHRDLIAHGPLDDRSLGTLARASLLPLGASLLLTRPIHMAVGAGLAVLAVAWSRPAELSASSVAFLLVLAAFGGALLSRAAAGALSPVTRRRKGDRGDSRMLGGIVLTVVGGVVFLHNYASARYLWPAAVPVAILVTRSAEEVAQGKRALLITAAAGGLLALSLALADWKFGSAHVAVARAVVESKPATSVFIGEWGFRYVLESKGWHRIDTNEANAGSLVVVDDQSGGHVPATWEALERFPSADRFPLRVVDVRHEAGLYSETLGPLPFTIADGALTGATLYRVAP